MKILGNGLGFMRNHFSKPRYLILNNLEGYGVFQNSKQLKNSEKDNKNKKFQKNLCC